MSRKGFWSILVLVGLDGLSKYLVLKLGLPYRKNYGIMLGWLPGSFWSAWFYQIVLVTLSFWFIIREGWPDDRRVGRFGLFFLSGALANFLSRFFWGYAVDFLDIKWFLVFYPEDWPRFFNPADVYLLIGSLGLLLALWL